MGLNQLKNQDEMLTMQETELKKKEKRKIGIEKEEEKPKKEKIKAEITEAAMVKKAEEKSIEVTLPTIPTLHTKPFKEIKTKIKAFRTEIPEIKPIKREIPKISIKTKPFKGISRKILAFNVTIPTIEKKIINLEVPHLTTKHFHGLKARNIHFNLELPEINIPKRPVFVPRIEVKPFSGVKAKEKNLISDIPQVLPGGIPLVEVIKRERGKEEIEKKEVTLEKEEIDEVGGGLLDILFAPIDKEHDLKGILRASSERPIVILAEKSEDDYIDALKLILREIYRIKKGGFPEAQVTKKEKEEVEAIKVERRIHIIDDSEGKFFEFLKINKVGNSEKVDMDKLLEERMEELFSQGFGFLVFHLKKENFDFLCNSFGTKEHKIPKLILIRGNGLKEEEREKISSASWGFLEPNGSWRSLSDYFSGYEKKFYNKLEKLSETKYAISVRESAEDEEGGKESNLHYLLKIFLVKYLREKLKIEGEIETETEKEGIIPDIFIPGENLAIEVETLYGTGMARLGRLGKTIGKYEGRGHKLWVVMPNLQLLLFHKNIREVIKTFRDKVELKIFGVDLNKGKLVPFDRFKKNKLSLMK